MISNIFIIKGYLGENEFKLSFINKFYLGEHQFNVSFAIF